MSKNISQEDLEELKKAKQLLENPGLTAKLTNLIGSPIENAINKLPKSVNTKIGSVTQSALMKATEAAVFTVKDKPGKESANRLHKLGVAVTGGVGGFFGITALAVELPLSTTIMLRSISEIARSHGESINEIDTKLACLQVFTLGGKNKSDDGVESGYYVVRSFLSNTISKSAGMFVKEGTTKSATLLMKFISVIAEKFSIQITEKVAAQSIPVIGAAGGAIINTVFMDHFQDMATGHFIVRKLDRKYGESYVKELYQNMSSSLQ
ncbi:MAG: hypothetical protein ACI81Y_000756 [Glaciecola sp.]|jgi:hypothetical protein